jgi:PKD repeat protein
MQFLTTDQASVATNCEDYTDYTYLPVPKIKAGYSFDITLTNGSCSGNHYAAYGAIYIDSSMNGIFEATERVGTTFGPSTALNQTFKRTFSVPITARRGVTGLRALWYEAIAPTSACYSYTFGETEDYLVEIFKDSIDLAVVKVDSPISGCSLTSVPVKFRVNNYGINAVTNPTFYYNVDGGPAVSETFTAVVTPNTIGQSFTFTTLANVPAIGSHTIKVWYANIKDTAKSNDTSKITMINYLTPNKPSIKNDTACVLSRSATLTAVSAPGITTAWYFPSYGNKVGEGSTYTVSNPVANSAYLVRSILSLSSFVGLPDTAVGTYLTDSSGRGLVFNVLDSAMFRLNTVDIYSDLTNLSIGIWIKNSAGVNIFPKITYVILNRGLNTVPINLDIPAGNGYRIVLDTGSGAKLFASTGTAYATNPVLNIPNVVKITGSTHAVASYYYFYNWNVTYSGCKSPIDTVRLVMASDTTPIRVLKDSVACFYPGVVLDAKNTNQNGVKYLWSNGAKTRTISTNVSGVYSVKISNAAGCNVTDTAKITIKVSPIFTLGNDTSFCSNSSLLLRTGYNNVGYNHRWMNLSDSLAIPDANKFNTFLNPPKSGMYVCNVLNTLTNCGYSDTVNITQYPTPNVFLGYDTLICYGGTYKLKGPINPNYAYLWFNNSTANNTTVTGPGKYWLKVTDISNAIQCASTDTIIVSYSSLTKPNLGVDSMSSCKSSETIGVASSSAYTYYWSSGENTSQISVNKDGTYILNVNELGTLCTFSDTIKVKFLSNPTLELGNDVSKCASSYKITANSGFTSYVWSNGFTVPFITVTTSGTYSVTASSACATVTDQVNVTLQQPPVVTLPNDTIVCSPLTLTIATPAVGNTILWSTNETGTSKTVNQTGIYWVSVTNLCGTYSDAISVTIDSTPIPKFGVQQYSSFINLTDSSKFARSYKWYFGDGDSSSLVNPSHFYKKSGTYTITLVVTNKCGTTQSITKSITISNSSIGNMTSDDFYVYPNPATSDVTVKIANINKSVEQIKLINMEGKELKSMSVEGKDQLIEQKIDVSDIPSGIYYISIDRSSANSLVKKIVVIK